MTVKEQLKQVAETLPDDATIEDAMERLYVLYKIQRGIEQIEAGQGIPHEEVVRRMRAKWGR